MTSSIMRVPLLVLQLALLLTLHDLEFVFSDFLRFSFPKEGGEPTTVSCCLLACPALGAYGVCVRAGWCLGCPMKNQRCDPVCGPWESFQSVITPAIGLYPVRRMR